MHATVHPYRRPSDAGTDPQDVVRTALAGSPEPAGAIVVDHRDGDEGTLVALWRDEAQAPTGTRTYGMVDRLDGVAAGRTPLFAMLTWVNSAGDPAVARAAERGGRERIHPAVRDVDGLVGVLVFRSADDRILVVGLATGMETHTEVQARIMRAPLLPGEDPTLLPGPDRVELGRILRADIPAEVPS
ncbi:hypothetical protein [Blastococcus haudaquaticus]|uniref:Uncharacterized protein n=1 Tax=Blastococcus haudaquaticus TaxID=1938745 RepID=A0A286GU93_9ACTN|nr:hypothetical protein [Blastococcus haudaquaticus]SOD99078.1 hypothetical protein SAMN06272739_2160 [Blastococcus haudaquaticus]